MNYDALHLFLLFPLIGAILSISLGKFYQKLSGYIATIAILPTFLQAIDLYLKYDFFNSNNVIEEALFTWFSFPNFSLPFSLYYDNISAVLLLTVSAVGLLVHLYSIYYIESQQARFFCYMNLFMLFMYILLLAKNLPIMFIGWEGVGLCSFLLIGFWYNKLNNIKAAITAFMINKLADLGLLGAMFILWNYTGNLDLTNNQLLCNTANNTILTSFSLLLFLAAAGKSAQFPLFIWLPKAMLGPTPVSALMHAATMVTAGVYLIIRFENIIFSTQTSWLIVCSMAIFTALFAALIAIFQTEIKKVLAYSTISQLALMILAASQNYSNSTLHLCAHAFFKATLFLAAGNIMHACNNEQNVHYLGGLAKKMPYTFITFLLASLALAGMFPFSGYFTKHAILNTFLDSDFSYVVPIINLISILTTVYISRLVYLTFFGKYRGKNTLHEVSSFMIFPLIILSSVTISWSLLFNDYLQTNLLYGLLSSWTVYVGIFISIFTNFIGKILNLKIKGYTVKLFFFICKKIISEAFYIEKLYQFIILKPFYLFAHFTYLFERYVIDLTYELIAKSFFIFGFILAIIDRYFIDFSVECGANILYVSGYILTFFQSGKVRTYAFWLFLSLLLTIFLNIIYLK